MEFGSLEEQLGKHLAPGSHHYRAFVSPPDKYDLVSALQFSLLSFLGLREEHYLLDIGCGSLRGGRLFIPYLLRGRYFGIEPEQWLIEEGIKHELGQAIIELKQPTFYNDRSFNLQHFQREFDFLLAQSIFSHASQVQIHACLAAASKVMKPQAIFVANFVESEVNYTGDEWVYPGGSTYTLEFMSQMVADHGLTCIPLDWPHPVNLKWIAIVRPEHAGSLPILSGQLPALKAERDQYRQRLEKLEHHPYVRIGLAMSRMLRQVKRRLRPE